MSKEMTDHARREAIEMMLPFYATGQLDPAEADQIRDYLDHHPDVASQLDLIRAERDSTVVTNGVFATRPVPSFTRVAAMIGTTAAMSARPASPVARPLDWIRRLFDMSAPHSLGWIGAAAALVILLQAAAIATMVVSHYTGAFGVAGGPGTTVPATTAFVRFADGAATSAVADALTGLGVTIVDGPKGGRLFTVRLGPKDMGGAERDRLIDALKARSDLVAFVTLAP